MKAVKKHSALEGIKKEQLKRRVFTLDFKAEVVRHRKAENLINRTFFMKDPTISNATLATVDPGMKVEGACFSVTIIEEYDCLFSDDYTTNGLIDIPVYNNTWELAGFNTYSVAGAESSVQSPTIPLPATPFLLGLGLLLLTVFQRPGVARVTALPASLPLMRV